MKKKSFLLGAIVVLLGPIGAYIGYYPRITCKPNQAGFWVIIALGMAIGVRLTQLFQWFSDQKKAKANNTVK